LNVYPDGGVSRLRVFCKLSRPNLKPLRVAEDLMERRVTVKTLDIEEYGPYGDVIDTIEEKGKSCNQGRAMRYNWLGDVKNLRPNAKLNVVIFNTQPQILPFEIKLLERHFYSTQMFLPRKDTRYLVIVALNGPDDKPDLSTLKVFIAENGQGVSYHPGTWHHPLVCLEFDLSFNCFIYEDGTDDDCHIVNLEKSLFCFENI